MTTGPGGGLSVCCLTAERPAMVARILSPFRAVAAEIVVAVDRRVPADQLGPLLDVADKVLRFEFVDPPERARPWLVAQCANPWVFMIDGDEMPSVELIAKLPDLLTYGATQGRVVRRWCFPDPDHWLAERPWWPDLQRRLLTNTGNLDYDVDVHGGARAGGPEILIPEPIYHLNCVLRPFGQRRARAREYEALRPGLVAVGGGSMNQTLFAPEHFATLAPRPTPEEDADRLHWILAAPDPPPASGIDLAVVSAQEIERSIPADGLGEHGYRARLDVLEVDPRTEPGQDTHLLVQVTNCGTATFPRADGVGVQMRVATHIAADADSPWILSQLPGDIPPGQSRVAEVLVRAPERSGRYDLEIDLINERSRWFGLNHTVELLVADRWGRHSL